ncbi:succinate dehydrogenase cytochrome b subunit [Deminuibacter soli]|uniref:Succinate dehydrogenase n=1 Tax=Deminuibacter soli TaxID=2291815 RepID=A0A3E1NKX9_9BACT|nr:succinate dehydrogenase cytochrome b subunit [Deminuibacter soli]RFM28557.1 succinate dehydrogenase [Deminuibacter soli]
MTWKQVFASSVGRKITMGLTGIFLILFLIVHVGLNACIWAMDHGAMFNRAAHFMGATVVPRILEVGLFVFLLLHIIQGLVLEASNRSKRGTAYAVNYGNRGSRWYSRSMGLLGTIILLFLCVHLVHFWIPSRFSEMQEIDLGNGILVHNLYGLMQNVFTEGWVSIVYVLGCISLAYHLAHGFLSAFKTVGVHNKRYIQLINGLGLAFSIIVPLAFAMMPLSFYFHWVN